MAALAADILTRVCTACPERGAQPWSAFYAHAKWPDGTMRRPQSRCKRCSRRARAEQKRAERLANPEKYAALNAEKYAGMRADPEVWATYLEYWRARRRRLEGITPDRYRVGQRIASRETTPAEPIREAFERSGATVAAVATAAGWDWQFTKRSLHKQARIEMGTALSILDAIGTLPVEVGL